MPPKIEEHVKDTIATATAIGKLPPEMICQIIPKLSFADSLSFARTCSFFYSFFVTGFYHNPAIDNHKAWFCLFKGSACRSLIVQKFLILDHTNPAFEKRLNERLESAIRFASGYGNVEVVKLLLNDPRVDPSAHDNYAIRWASRNGHVEVVKLLLNDPRVDPSADNNCAIRWASRNGHVEVVKLLLNYPRVDPSAYNNDAMRCAPENGHAEVVKLCE
jgi:ankyrin repeat protein